MYRLGDVLEALRPKIIDPKFEPRLDLPVGILGQANPARLADAFEPRRNIHPIAHQVAVALFDNVAKMDAHPDLDAAFGRQACVTLDHAGLHLDRAAHRIHHAAELDEVAVAGALDDAPVMGSEGGVDQIAPQAPQARQRAILVRAGEPAVADNVRDQNRRNLSGLAHERTSAIHETNTTARPNQPISPEAAPSPSRGRRSPRCVP